MKYENLACPVCGSVFGKTDDVVVCPKCGTPHHRSCWVELGHCVNEDKHAQGFVWVSPIVEKPNEVKDEPIKKNTAQNKEFRDNSNRNFPNRNLPFDNDELMKMGGFRPIDGEEQIGDLKVKDYGEYIDKNKHKYIPKFYRMAKTKQKMTWNWAAFFFNVPWLFYRKMNAIGAIIAAFAIIIPVAFASDFVNYTQESMSIIMNASQGVAPSDLQALLPEPPLAYNVARYIHFAIQLFCGMFGNYFYMKKATNDIKKIKEEKLNETEYEIKLKKKGSVSIWNMLLALFIIYSVMDIAFKIAFKTGCDISMFFEKIIMYFQ